MQCVLSLFSHLLLKIINWNCTLSKANSALYPFIPPLPNTHNTNKLTNKKTVNNYDGFLRVSSILRHSERKIRLTLHRCKNIFTKCFKFPWQRLTTRNKWKPSLVCCSLLLLPPSYETIRIKYKVLFFLNFCSQAK